ncbi:MAG: YihY/virulence factor BrkB family protein [Bacteroidota bacterium]
MKNQRYKRIEKRFEEHPRVQSFLDWTKKRSLPGLEGIPVYDVFIFYRNEVRRDRLTNRSKAIAFSFLLAIFPSIIFIFTLLPYVPIKDFDKILLNFVEEVLPENAYQVLFSTIEDLVSIPRGGLLSLGFILAIWFSTNGVLGMLNAFNKNHKETFRRRNIVEKRWVAFKLTMILFFLLLISIFFIIAGDVVLRWVLDFFNAAAWSYFATVVLKWMAILFLFYGAISSIYRYGPATRQKFRFFSPGATVATILSIITSLGFSFFVNNFGKFNQFYGSIGTLIVAMIWLNLNSMILLIGFELNSSIAINRHQKTVIEEK